MIKELLLVPAEYKHGIFHLDSSSVVNKINECVRALNNLEALNTTTNHAMTKLTPCNNERGQRVKRWLYLGYKFCPYCGRQL